jgi:anti-sigma factor RsiW
MDYSSGTTRTDCATVAPLLDDYVKERLEEGARRAVRTHLLGCTDCAGAAARLDPSILFMGMGQEVPRPEFWAGFDAGLRARIEAEKSRPRPFWSDWDFRPSTPLGMPRLAFAAPLAMLALLVGLVFVSQPGMILRGPRGVRVEGIRPPNEAAPPMRPGAGRAKLDQVAAGPRLAARFAGTDIAALPTLEEVSSPAARVYRLDVGTTSGAAAPAGGADAAGSDAGVVYFVVDETINF